ncbi:hypothetical protein [Pseudoduganella violacea]|uniref:Uncharacterized protein n=1 Tax=Pseudoduganella violacea TaxID=1715466 RepID=A0A7W5BBX8_9BURK|nr:hypothetical protein [Pseudoduganella violacea]MBB3119505.1 hypothetical protein [Pseudoduganella violacea]
MKFSRSKWLAYTFLVGLIPVLMRLLVWAAAKAGKVEAFAAPDFVSFGLVLHISIINEMEQLPQREKNWKAIQNGTSIIFIALYGALYALAILGGRGENLVDSSAVLRSSVFFVSLSIALSLSTLQRLSRARTR